MIGSRQYSRDLRIETRRPEAPRDLVYDENTGELTWTGPIRGPQYTHFNIRLDDDSAATSFRLPAGTTRLFIGRTAKVSISCWNEVVQTEGASARLSVGGASTWEGATSAALGPMFFYRVRYELTSDFTVVSPVASRANRRLVLRVRQDDSTQYVLSLDPANFVDSLDQQIDLSFEWVREYDGNDDGKWYPVGAPFVFDPTI